MGVKKPGEYEKFSAVHNDALFEHPWVNTTFEHLYVNIGFREEVLGADRNCELGAHRHCASLGRDRRGEDCHPGRPGNP